MRKIIVDDKKSTEKTRVPLDQDAREAYMVNLAYNLAEQQLIDGTATSQVITHFLKLGTMREEMEIENLKKQNELLIAKVEPLKSAKRIETLYEEALNAMRDYSGQSNLEDTFDD